MIVDSKDIESGALKDIFTPKQRQQNPFVHASRGLAVKIISSKKKRNKFIALYLFICKRQIHNSNTKNTWDEAPQWRIRFCFIFRVVLRAIGNHFFFWVRRSSFEESFWFRPNFGALNCFFSRSLSNLTFWWSSRWKMYLKVLHRNSIS